jgi:hypothetical protein
MPLRPVPVRSTTSEAHTRCIMNRHTALLAILITIAGSGCATKQQPAPAGPKGYAFWPPAPDAPHVQFLTAINSSKDVAPRADRAGLQDMLYGAEQEQVLAVQKPYWTCGCGTGGSTSPKSAAAALPSSTS